MLQTNQRIPFCTTKRERKFLFHPETIRSILRFTYGSSMREVYWLPYPKIIGLGNTLLSRGTGLQTELFYYCHVQRRTQYANSYKARLSKIYEKIKEKICPKKSI